MKALLRCKITFCVIGILAASLNTSILSGATYSTLDALETAMQTAAPGTILKLQSGVYPNSGPRTWRPASGTSTNPIVIEAEDPGQVVFTGSTSITVGASNSQTSYVIIRGFRFDNAVNTPAGEVLYMPLLRFRNIQYGQLSECAFVGSGNATTQRPNGQRGSYGTYDQCVQILDGSSHIRIDHNFFQGTLSQCISFLANGYTPPYVGSSAGPWHWVDHNHFKDISCLIANGQETLQIGQAVEFSDKEMHIVVEDNLMDNAFGNFEYMSVKTSNNILRNNTYQRATLNFQSLYLRAGQDNTLDGNYLFNSPMGITAVGNNHVIVNNYLQDVTNRYYSAHHYGAINIPAGTSESKTGSQQASARTLVANNTIVNSHNYPQGGSTEVYGIFLGDFFGEGPDRIGVQPPGVGLGIKPNRTAIFNNLVYGSEGDLIRNNASLNSTWGQNVVWPLGAANAGDPDAGILNTDPGLNTSSSPFRLSSTSWAIGQANSTYSPILDMEGETRDSSPDVGADEYKTGTGIRRPLVAADVGPTWAGRSDTSTIPDSTVMWGPATTSADIMAPTMMSVGWGAVSPAPAGYRVRFRSPTIPWTLIKTLHSPSSTTALLTNLKASRNYYFQVQAVDANGRGSAWSPVISEVTPAGYEESNASGISSVTLEAESYSVLANTDSSYPNWAVVPFGPADGVGVGYVQGSGTTGTAPWATSPGMNYDVLFHDAGTYNVWIRCLSNNSGSASLRWGTGTGTTINQSTSYSDSTGYVIPSSHYGAWNWEYVGTWSISSGDLSTLKTLSIRRALPGLLIDRIHLTTGTSVPNLPAGPSASDFIEPPAIDSSPVDIKATYAGAPVNLSVTVKPNANPSPTYQWNRVTYSSTSGTTNNVTTTAIPGATTSNYTISSPIDTDTGYYSVTVSNVANTIVSPTFAVSVASAPVFTSSPQLAPATSSVTAGGSLTLTASADLKGNTSTVTWYRDGVSVGGGAIADPANASSTISTLTYTLSPATQSQAGNYYVVIKNKDNLFTPATSNTVSVAVDVSGVSGIPRGWAGYGGRVAFEAEAYNSNYAAGGYAAWVTGSSGSPALAGYVTSYMRCDATDGDTSWSAAPGMDYNIAITETGTYHAWVRCYAFGSSNELFRWGINGTEKSPSGGVEAETHSAWTWVDAGTFTPDSTGILTFNLRRCDPDFLIDRIYITNKGDMPTGSGPSASPLGGAAPSITAVSPSSVCLPIGTLGTPVTLGVTANNATGFQWKQNGVALSGQTTATLTISNVPDLPPFAGTNAPRGIAGTYTVDAYNAFGRVTSPPIEVVVQRVAHPVPFTTPTGQSSIPLVPAVPGNPIYAQATKPLLLSVAPDFWYDGSSAYAQRPTAYQWYFNGSPISSTWTTGMSYLIPSVTSANAGYYQLRITMKGEYFYSPTIWVSVY